MQRTVEMSIEQEYLGSAVAPAKYLDPEVSLVPPQQLRPEKVGAGSANGCSDAGADADAQWHPADAEIANQPVSSP
jgi:hypothetical protein